MLYAGLGRAWAHLGVFTNPTPSITSLPPLHLHPIHPTSFITPPHPYSEPL